jgi:hypothetical protein
MLPRAVAPLALLVALLVPGAALIAACSSASSDLASPAGGAALIHGYESETDASDAGVGPDAAENPSSVGTQVAQGNAICHASKTMGCYPDTVVDACDLPDDGGAADAATDGAAAYPAGCHVITDATGMLQTKCLPSKLQGMYASTCSQSTDCSPGWECVSEGTCRHYCCSGNSSCSDNQFCDVQPTAQYPNIIVPVCVAEMPCTLIDIDGCPTGEQCSVVKEDGTTSCVAIGPQGDGQSCDLEHCAHGYVCLGPTGSRQCAPLCYTASVGSCTNGRTCVGTLPLFTNPLVGACQ